MRARHDVLGAIGQGSARQSSPLTYGIWPVPNLNLTVYYKYTGSQLMSISSDLESAWAMPSSVYKYRDRHMRVTRRIPRVVQEGLAPSQSQTRLGYKMECWKASYARSSSSGNSTVVDASSSRVWLGDPGNAGITEPATATTITAEAGVFQARVSSRDDSTNEAT